MGLLIARRRDLRDEPPFRDGGTYGTSLFTALVITGRSRLRDEPPYGTGRMRLRDELLTGRRLGEPLTGLFNYGMEALTGRTAYELKITARRDLRAALTGRLSLRDSSYGTTGRRSLRDEPLCGTFHCEAEGLTGRASFRDGGAYGTSPYGTCNYGTEALTGRASLRDS